MHLGPEKYNIAAIRSLLKAAFTADTFRRFCQDRTDFRPVLSEIGSNAGVGNIIDVLLEHCRTQLLFDDLISAVREVNPRQYARHEAQLYASEAAALPTPQIPHNLPPRSEFIGREAEKARIHEGLRSRYAIISIDGIGGIGKSSLALEVAHECFEASRATESPEGTATFDSFVWATAKDHGLTLNTLLDTIALTLDYPGILQHPLMQKRFAAERLIREQSCLLLMDNFETVTEEGVWDFLRHLPEPSKALITTREQKLSNAWAVPLKGLEESEALALIRSQGRRFDLDTVTHAKDETLLPINQATGGAPLAIKWAVGQIGQRGQSVGTVLKALREARGSIFEDIFDRSWSLLSPDSRQLLIAMPFFVTSASQAALEAGSDIHHFALYEALGQLVEMNLIDATDDLEDAERRYQVHPLTRAFVTHKLKEKPEIQKLIHERLARFFLAFAADYGDRWFDKQFTQLDRELPNILATIRRCWESGFIELGMEIFRTVCGFMNISGYWTDVLELGHQAVMLALERDDVLTAAQFRAWPLGWAYRHIGDLDKAERHLSAALTVFEQLDKKRDAANAKRNLARIAQQRGKIDQAERLIKEAGLLFESVGDKVQTYWVTANFAEVELARGNLDAAWMLGERARSYAQEFGRLEYSALFVLARVAQQRHNLGQAKALWQEALMQTRRANHREATANTLLSLAEIEVETGQKEIAKEMLSEAQDIFRRLDMQTDAGKAKALLTQLSQQSATRETNP